MAKYDYLFVDESGDPGFALDGDSGVLLSSPYYSLAAFHVTDESYSSITGHIPERRHMAGHSRELKIPVGKPDFERLLEPIQTAADGGALTWASVVYLDKRQYTGSYLKNDGSRPQTSVYFRNFILRCLLEFHFARRPLVSQNWDLVLDRVQLSDTQQSELREYLAGNRRIPTPTNITHASSIYVDGLQIVHHIANGFGDVAEGHELPAPLQFAAGIDVTYYQPVARSRPIP